MIFEISFAVGCCMWALCTEDKTASLEIELPTRTLWWCSQNLFHYLKKFQVLYSFLRCITSHVCISRLSPDYCFKKLNWRFISPLFLSLSMLQALISSQNNTIVRLTDLHGRPFNKPRSSYLPSQWDLKAESCLTPYIGSLSLSLALSSQAHTHTHVNITCILQAYTRSWLL